ncbi:MAG: hypothetical protein IJE43_19595 [Alphaproteobacteria bacterium]|nr:hypothetical protein [Alphaproteobacteria bacterium]
MLLIPDGIDEELPIKESKPIVVSCKTIAVVNSTPVIEFNGMRYLYNGDKCCHHVLEEQDFGLRFKCRKCGGWAW